MQPEYQEELGNGRYAIDTMDWWQPRRRLTLGIRAKALAAHIGQWNPHMDIDLTPVVDDEESAAI